MMSNYTTVFTAIKDMAANLERKWRNQFVFMQDQVMPADDDVQGGSCYRLFVIGPFMKIFACLNLEQTRNKRSASSLMPRPSLVHRRRRVRCPWHLRRDLQ